MGKIESLNHTKWDCKYHVVFIPKCHRKTLYGELRMYLGNVFRALAQDKESRIEEGPLYALLDLYARPLCQAEPAICIDEKSLQLTGHSREPLPMAIEWKFARQGADNKLEHHYFLELAC